MAARQTFTTATAFLIAALATSLQAAPHKSHQLSCKKVHDAVWAGDTLEQLTAEFNTDAAHIMKCLQARKGKKPAPQAKKKKAAAPAAPGKKNK